MTWHKNEINGTHHEHFWTSTRTKSDKIDIFKLSLKCHYLLLMFFLQLAHCVFIFKVWGKKLQVALDSSNFFFISFDDTVIQ